MKEDKYSMIREALAEYFKWPDGARFMSRELRQLLTPETFAALLADIDAAREHEAMLYAEVQRVREQHGNALGERDAERIRADANEQDANRYRWLRGNYSGVMELLGEILYFTPEKLDKAITTAIEKEKND